MKIKNKNALIISILIPIAVGLLSSLLSGNMSEFAKLNKPAISPPAFIFPIVWTILYILMGISSYMIYISDNPHKEKALKVYVIQLFINFFWSILFFGLSQLLIAFLWLLLLIFFVIRMICEFYQINQLSAYLQIPYLLWCSFAAVLNFMFFIASL